MRLFNSLRTPSAFSVRATIGLALGVAFGVIACSSDGGGGDDDDDDDDDDGETNSDTGTGTGTSSQFYCCINGAYHDCAGKAELDQCIGFDIDGCMGACAFDDFMCQDGCFDQWASSSPNPSACVRNAAADATCNGSSGTGTGTGESTGTGTGTDTGSNCSGILSGCDYDDDCCSQNCTNNTCYGNSFGDPCDYDDDCSSNNCFDGSCQ